MTKPPAEPAFALGVVILAAGRSARMGRPKLLLPWGATSVLGQLIAQWQALHAAQIAVVCAPAGPPIVAELDRLGFPLEGRIINPSPERGMFSSIQCAARWPGWQAALTHCAQVLDFSAAHPGKVCQPGRRGHGRHPVVLPRGIFKHLAGAKAGTLKQFLATEPRQIALCELDDSGLDLDIDRPEDYQRALKEAGFSL
jgi:molybdenum cofactor cytidylyltransferase